MPFGVIVLRSSFGAEPYTKSNFISALLFPDHFSETTGWRTTKLNSGDLKGP